MVIWFFGVVWVYVLLVAIEGFGVGVDLGWGFVAMIGFVCCFVVILIRLFDLEFCIDACVYFVFI